MMSPLRSLSRLGLPALGAGLLAASLGMALGPTPRTHAGVVQSRVGRLLVGRDDDNAGPAMT